MTASTISDLSLHDLAADLRLKLADSSPDDAPAWQLLVDLADQLDDESTDDTLVRGRRWMLESVSVHGFRGAVQPVTMELNAYAGLTVLHGENGSGKSSLAEAVRMALRAEVAAPQIGQGGKPGLWGSTDHRSRGATSSHIVLVLLDDNDPSCRLTITVRQHDSWVERTAELSNHGVVTAFGSDSPAWGAWDQAVQSSPPVLAYAELFNELRQVKDLHGWLTRCLSIDAAAVVLNDEVTKYTTRCRAAATNLEAAQQRAAASVKEIDQSAADHVTDIQPIEWRCFYTDAELTEWIEQHDLHQRQRQHQQLQRELLTELRRWADEFTLARQQFDDSATHELTPDVIAGLLHLGDSLSNQADTAECPVCGTEQARWRDHLLHRLPTFDATRKASSTLQALCRRRSARVVKPMQQVLAALPTSYEDETSRRIADEHTQILCALEAASSDLDPQLLDALGAWCTWISSAEAGRLIDSAVASSDRRHQWLCDRREAIEPFLDTWTENRTDAAIAERWKIARNRWNNHLGELRKSRSRIFEELVTPKVSVLLADVGLEIAKLDVQKNGSTIEIVDASGTPVDLGHLSAGQRNALILGPMLVAAEGGLFGFCIVDDPVHAFDEFRVDQLALTMSEIAASQALVITTHDGRFVEYLRVHAPSAFTVFDTKRSLDGQVTLTVTDSPWATLLTHAKALHKPSRKAGLSPEGASDIGALLRMAVDAAIEALFLRVNGRRPITDRSEHRAKFDSAMETKKRIGYLSGSFEKKSDRSAFDTARNGINPYLDQWNDTTHAPAAADDTGTIADQLAAAEQFCADLDTIGR